MSGDELRVMIVFGFSTVTVVRSGGSPVQLLARVEPVAIRLALGQVEAGRRPILGRAAAGAGIGSHLGKLGA